MAHKWCAIKNGGTTVAYEWAEDASITPPDGCTVEYFDTPQTDLIAEVAAGMVSSKLTALKNIDASAETGTMKTVVEFLQELYG